MSKPIELNDVDPGPPLVYKRRMGWAESDSARIVNSGRYLDFAMAAVEAWFRHIWGRDWHAMHVDLDMGSPMVHFDIDFLAPLEPGDLLAVSVYVERLGRSSLSFALEGMRQDGVPCFRCGYVSTIVAMAPHMHAVPVPAEQRRRIEAYIDACGGQRAAAAGAAGEAG